LLALKITLGSFGYPGGDYHVQGKRGHGDEGKFPTDGEHHGHTADEGNDGANNLYQALLERVGYGVHVVGYPGKHVPVGSVIEKREGKPFEFPVDGPAKSVNGFLGYRGHDQLGGVAKGGRENVQGQQDEQDGGHPVVLDDCAGGMVRHGLDVVNQQVDRKAENFGPRHRKGGAEDGKTKNDKNRNSVGPKEPDEASQASLEVFSPFYRTTHSVAGAPAHSVAGAPTHYLCAFHADPVVG